MDNDPDNDEDEEDIETGRPIEPRIICEHKKKEKRRKKEKKAEGASSSAKKDPEPLKGNPVCPWEDE